MRTSNTSYFKPSLTQLSIAMLALVSTLASAEEADEPSVDLGELVVTAKKGNITVKESAQKVMVIGRDEIEEQLLVSDDTSQALSKLIPGYAPASEKLGTVGESFRGREVLFMIDGVPQSNPLRDGSRESRTIDLAMVERIEVVYGASAEQGLGATGGIINFVTKSNRDHGINQQISVSASTAETFKSDGLGGDVRYQLNYGGEKADALVAVKYAKEGMYYQADGRMVGIYGNQGDTQGSQSYDIFAKAGYQIDDEKRIGASVNYYHLDSDATLDYENVAGNRATGLTDTAIKYTGSAYRGETPYNDVLTVNATYSDDDFFGTRLLAQAFYNDFTARYGANYAANYQDPSIATVGTLLDQSQNESTKIGAKLAVSKEGLWQDKVSVTAGVDVLQDETEQNLILTNRVWAPLMQYRSVAPFVEARVRLADRLSVNAGVRQESGNLKVDDFYTLAGYTRSIAARRYTSTFVEGGEVDFSETLPNVGVVYELTPNTQVFASYAKGLGMPDVGGTLRAINQTGHSVDTINLEPIITDNTEVGVRFADDKVSADFSVYQSKSDLGSTLEYDSVLEGYRAVRQATDIKGAEASLRYQLTPSTQVSASYAYAKGEYDANGDGVMVDMPARNISPNKLSLGLNYRFADSDKRFGMTATHLFARDYPDVTSGSTSYESKFDGYTLVDLTYKQPLGKGTIGLGVNNLLNEEYDVFLTETVLPTSDRYTGGRGRNYTVSYTLDF